MGRQISCCYHTKTNRLILEKAGSYAVIFAWMWSFFFAVRGVPCPMLRCGLAGLHEGLGAKPLCNGVKQRKRSATVVLTGRSGMLLDGRRQSWKVLAAVAIFVGAVESIAPHLIALARGLWDSTGMDVVTFYLRRRHAHGSRRE